MNASKLMKVTYFDPKSDIRLLCYADTVVWDTKPAPTLIALRFGGYPERVQGLADAIYGGATIEIEDGNAIYYSLMTLPKQYRREVSRDGVYAEATLIAEDDGQNASRPSGKKEDTTQEDAPSDEEFEQVEQDLPPRNTYAFLFRSLMVEGETLLPQRASVISSTRRTDTPARYISIRASSTLLSRRRYRSMMVVSKVPCAWVSCG